MGGSAQTIVAHDRSRKLSAPREIRDVDANGVLEGIRLIPWGHQLDLKEPRVFLARSAEAIGIGRLDPAHLKGVVGFLKDAADFDGTGRRSLARQALHAGVGCGVFVHRVDRLAGEELVCLGPLLAHHDGIERTLAHHPHDFANEVAHLRRRRLIRRAGQRDPTRHPGLIHFNDVGGDLLLDAQDDGAARRDQRDGHRRERDVAPVAGLHAHRSDPFIPRRGGASVGVVTVARSTVLAVTRCHVGKTHVGVPPVLVGPLVPFGELDPGTRLAVLAAVVLPACGGS